MIGNKSIVTPNYTLDYYKQQYNKDDDGIKEIRLTQSNQFEQNARFDYEYVTGLDNEKKQTDLISHKPENFNFKQQSFILKRIKKGSGSSRYTPVIPAVANGINYKGEGGVDLRGFELIKDFLPLGVIKKFLDTKGQMLDDSSKMYSETFRREGMLKFPIVSNFGDVTVRKEGKWFPTAGEAVYLYPINYDSWLADRSKSSTIDFRCVNLNEYNKRVRDDCKKLVEDFKKKKTLDDSLSFDEIVDRYKDDDVLGPLSKRLASRYELKERSYVGTIIETSGLNGTALTILMDLRPNNVFCSNQQFVTFEENYKGKKIESDKKKFKEITDDTKRIEKAKGRMEIKLKNAYERFGLEKNAFKTMIEEVLNSV
jgi:hypothetical protein